MKLFSFLLMSMTLCTTTLFAEGTTQWSATSPRTDGTPTQNWSVARDPNDTSYRRVSANTKNAERFSLMNAEVTPFQLSLFTPVEVPWGDWDVRGLRLSVPYGCARNVTGLDIGICSAATETLTGWQIGAANMGGYTRGLQTGALNCASRLKGLQVGIINYADSANGLQIGLINVISDSSWPFSLVLNMCF